MFSRRGYRVDTAQSGQAGIRQLRKERPDVVVSDIKMPEVTGIDVLRAAREVDLFLPVILITARADVDTAIQALNEGAFQYIQKPFENRELLAKVENALQLRGRLAAIPLSDTERRNAHARNGLAESLANLHRGRDVGGA